MSYKLFSLFGVWETFLKTIMEYLLRLGNRTIFLPVVNVFERAVTA